MSSNEPTKGPESAPAALPNDSKASVKEEPLSDTDDARSDTQSDGSSSPDNLTPELDDIPEFFNEFLFDTGDIRILVTHNEAVIEGKVSSHSLCNISPI